MKTSSEKDVEDLSDDELEALDREVAKMPEGRAVLRRALLPDAPPMRIYRQNPVLWWRR